MDRKLLDILACPASKVGLKPLPRERLTLLNERVAAGQLRYADGETVETPLQDALITENDALIYRIDDEVPTLLVERGIPARQLEERS